MTNHRPPTRKEMKRKLPVYGSKPADELARVVADTERDHPLPRCKHGNALRDGSGERLEPSCGCRAADVLSAPIGTELPAPSDPRSGNHPAPPALVDEFIAWVERYGDRFDHLIREDEINLFARVTQALMRVRS